MKRAFEQVTSDIKLFNLPELTQLSTFCNELRLEKSHEVTEAFFGSGGREVFEGEILFSLSHRMRVGKLLRLREVCKKWSVFLLTVKHFYLKYYGELNDIPFQDFPCLTSLKLRPTTFSSQTVPQLGRIKELTFSAIHPYRIGSISLSKWKLLEKLTIDFKDPFKLHGLSGLTNLKSLHCHVSCFSSHQDVYQLTNLTSLEINQFPIHEKLSEKLPLLSHLVSGSPIHFIGFIGNGRLDSELLSYTDQDLLHLLKNDYYPRANELSCQGEWQSGVFTGRVSFRETGGEKDIYTESYMKNGKLEGFRQSHDFINSIGSIGKWCGGKRDGFHAIYRWGEYYSLPRRASIYGVVLLVEYWIDGVFISTDICNNRKYLYQQEDDLETRWSRMIQM